MTDIAMMLPTSDITNNSHPITRPVTVPDEEKAEKETMNQVCNLAGLAPAIDIYIVCIL